MTETAIFYIDGSRYVFRGEEIDAVLDRVKHETSTFDEAWRLTKHIGEQQS